MKTALLSLALVCLTSAAWAGGDTIRLKDGKTYHGDILFTNNTNYVISVDGEAVDVPMSQIRTIEFGPR